MNFVALKPVVKRGEAEFNNRLEGPQNSLLSERQNTKTILAMISKMAKVFLS